MTYSAFEVWALIAGLALVTLVARSFFLVLPRRWQPRGRIEQALRYAPLAALLAITAPEIVQQLPAALQQTTPGSTLRAVIGDARFISALVLAAVILRTRHALWGLGAGSACYLALLWLAS